MRSTALNSERNEETMLRSSGFRIEERHRLTWDSRDGRNHGRPTDDDRRTWDSREGRNRGRPTDDRRRGEIGRKTGDSRPRDNSRNIEPSEVENGDANKRRKVGEVLDRQTGAAAEKNEPPKDEKAKKAENTLRSGGVYIIPIKLAEMMRDVGDESSKEYQRLTWDALRKSINGLVNKVNRSNIKDILRQLFSENLRRGRGLFARSCMKAQLASPTFTHVFAALVAVVNSKIPEVGELLIKRLLLQLRRAYKRDDKPALLAAAKFVAHLLNQQVAHEIIGLQLVKLLLEKPSEDSVDVAVGFVKECGAVLQNVSPQGLNCIFERFRGILHEGMIDKRVQFMIEGLFALRKAKSQWNQGVLPELDLVEGQDQITHALNLDDNFDGEASLDVFNLHPDFLENERNYEVHKKVILGDESDKEGLEDGEIASDEDESHKEDEDEDEREERIQIQDETETNLVNLRKTIYLTIMSSRNFEDAGHKLLKIRLELGQEMELCIMLLECCSHTLTYLRDYGLLGQRFCLVNRVYQEHFDDCFKKQYSMSHQMETNKLRNVAKFFAHLLGSDALPWQALACIRLTEEHTTSSSRIFIKILFQELSEHLGLRRLSKRLSDPTMQKSFDGIFPKNNPKNNRFAVNFFTSIGLGGLTDSLGKFLENMPRLEMQPRPAISSDKEQTHSSSGDTSSGSEASDSDTSSAESKSGKSEEEKRRRSKKARREGK